MPQLPQMPVRQLQVNSWAALRQSVLSLAKTKQGMRHCPSEVLDFFGTWAPASALTHLSQDLLDCSADVPALPFRARSLKSGAPFLPHDSGSTRSYPCGWQQLSRGWLARPLCYSHYGSGGYRGNRNKNKNKKKDSGLRLLLDPSL
jgi:hypothetical protein